MKKYVSLRIHTMGEKTIKSNGKRYRGLKDQLAHNRRAEKMDEGYLLNPELKDQNIHKLYKSSAHISDRGMKIAHDYKQKHNRKMPSNLKPYIDGLITFSRTMGKDIKRFGREKMFDEVKQFLRDEGFDLIGLDLHMDETTPHFHFSAMNWHEPTRQAYSSKMRSEIKANDNANPIQDRFAEHLSNTIDGFDYVRGEPRNIKEYHDKRAAQQAHLKTQQEDIAKLKVERDKILEDNQALKNQLTEANEQLTTLESSIQEMKDLEAEHEKQLADVFSHMYDLLDTGDGNKFLRLLNRYIRNDNKERLVGLMDKFIRVADAKGLVFDGQKLTQYEELVETFGWRRGGRGR